MEIKSPYFVLKSEFKTSAATSSFSNFIDYLNRKEAKENVANQNKEFDIDGFKTYLNYMDRESALLQKEKLTDKDLLELEFIAKDKPKLEQKLRQMKKDENTSSPIQHTGMFDLVKDDLTSREVGAYQKKFNEAYQKGNVMFTDVVSFDTQGLIEAGIYNPYTKELKREPLIKASQKMIQTMIQQEQLSKDLIAVGAIHYNTKHFHVHLASIEPNYSSRKLMGNEQRGKRKLSTLEKMKSTYINSIFDRTEQLSKISTLRNELRQNLNMKMNTFEHETLELHEQYQKIKSFLPEDKQKWNSKNLSEPARKEMYQFIDLLMKDNPDFPLYKNLVKEENDFKEQTYGQLDKNKKSYYENRIYGEDGIYYRLSNTVLEQMKKEEEKNSSTYGESLSQISLKGGDNKIITQAEKKECLKTHLDEQRKRRLTSKFSAEVYQLKHMTYLLNNDYEKWKEEQEHEQMTREIEFVRQQNEWEIEL